MFSAQKKAKEKFATDIHWDTSWTTQNFRFCMDYFFDQMSETW